MKAKSAFGTQADRNDCSLKVGIASMVLGVAAIMLVDMMGDASSNQDSISTLLVDAPVTAPMHSFSTMNR